MAKPHGNVVTKCPGCDVGIGYDHPYTWCQECGGPLPEDTLLLLRKSETRVKYNVGGSKEDLKQNASSLDASPTSQSPQSTGGKTSAAQGFKNRYKDAYLVARATDMFGSGIKVLGICIALTMILIAFLVVGSSTSRDGELGIVIAIASGFFGIFSGSLLYLLGVLVSSQGQILKASLDGSVNTSPFLTDDDRAEMMSISNG